MWNKLKKLKKILIILPALIALSGCKSIVGTKGYCSVAEIIYVSQEDSLTDETVKQILVHNTTYEAICG